MYEVLLFAGTTEGRQIAEFLKTQSRPACVFTATEYGGMLLEETDQLTVSAGRMDADAMERCFRENPGAIVVDATHPYAAEVSRALRTACDAAGNPYWRVLRAAQTDDRTRHDNTITVPSVADAVTFLAKTEGAILLTTGSKNLKEFAQLPAFTERVYARVLSVPASVAQAEAVGLRGTHLLCMQGPFSREMNLACIRHVGAKWLVTKDTGVTGGFPEKLEAAAETGCRVVIIGRPQEEQGMSVAQCIARLGGNANEIPQNLRTEGAEDDPGDIRNSAPVPPVHEVALIGVGAGADLTCSAADWLRTSDLIIGAGRMLASVPHAHADVIEEYRADTIRGLLAEDRTHHRVSILFSGDTGFFSGAAAFDEVRTGEFRCFPGISSLSAFSARTGIPWDHTEIVSIHGRSASVISRVRRSRRTFCLLGKPGDVQTLCEQFLQYGLRDLHLWVGERLGDSQERITEGCPEDFLTWTHDPIAVLLIENPAPDTRVTPGIPDADWTRGRVPMTKEEIRTVAISKLRLTADAILYDIGAGTGSISIEAARLIPDGMVYAIEENPEGIDLITQNRLRFGTDNLQIVHGHAPEAFAGLPTPDAALIGGSRGAVREIIAQLRTKNPSVRVVVTAITLETVSAVLEALRAADDGTEPEIVQVTVARARKAGSSHMMMGQNPVWLISFGGEISDTVEADR